MSREDWQKQTDWMRAVGAQAATWDEEGRLRSVALGPEPIDQSKRETPLNPQTARQREEERRRVILAAGPRLREVPGGRSDQSER